MRRTRHPFIETLKNFHPLKETFIENRWRLAAGLFSLLLVDFLQLMIPLVIKRAVDALTTRQATPETLLKAGIAIVAIAGCIALFRYIWRLFLFGHSQIVEKRLRNKLYAHLQNLSVSFYHRTKTGDLMARSINDINAVRMAAGLGLVALTDGLILGIAAIGFMLYINPYLTLMALIPTPIVIYITKILTRRMSAGFESVQKTFSDLTERVREGFSGIRIIKAYARESWQTKKIEIEGRRYISKNIALARTVALLFPLMALFTNLGLAIVIGLGGRFTISGHITTGDFVAFISYLNLLAWPLMAIGWVTNLVQRGAASMRRINRVLDETPEILDSAPTRVMAPFRGRIRFNNLSYRFAQKDGLALHGITLDIEETQTVALVGKVGSGKTTLLHIIPRLYTVPRGMVLIDEHDIHDVPIATLRKNIGFITQEAVIFSDTIRNNVIFGRNDISEERLLAVLKTAQIHDEITALEKGVDTMLGERGLTLSGGQRQRLTIARALISDPSILILDDALSMVDTHTEGQILKEIFSQRREKTNVIVSHRVSTIQYADQILVLDDGRLIESGDHDALMRAGNLYAELYERQLLAEELAQVKG